MSGRRTRLTINGALVAATTLAGLAAWPWLPSTMALHFSASGEPGSYVPPALGVVFVPAAMVVTHVVLEKTFEVDPPEVERTGTVASVSTVALLATLQGLVLAWNLGYGVPFDRVLVGVLAWGTVLLAYALWRE